LIAPIRCPRVNAVAGGHLQEGIYSGPNATPPGFFSLVFLSATRGAKAVDVADLLADLWARYQCLKKPQVPDLDGAPPVPDRTLAELAAELEVLLGFGPGAFTLAQLPAAAAGLPVALKPEQRFLAPDTNGGGPITPNSGIRYENDVTANPADAAFVLQFTAKTPLAVERAVVETWKVLWDDAKQRNGPAPLAITAAYTGTARDDGRSWIDFHDGPSNLAPDERPKVIEIPQATPATDAAPWAPPAQDAWTCGGTYLAFVRLYIDLAVWRPLSKTTQEALVGREKLSGLPLIKVGQPFPANPTDKGQPPHEADPAGLTEDVQLSPAIRRSHIQRANQHDPYPPGGPANPGNPQNHRIYRQGYPFLEPQGTSPGFRVGLNFVSFQSTPANLIQLLESPNWLGNVNFGGDPSIPGDEPVVLTSARAAGVFLVPPVEDPPTPGKPERFPGDHALTGHQR
jgi:deferrochelatase/peroxidase EfeB